MSTETLFIEPPSVSAAQDVLAILGRAGCFRTLLRSLQVTGLDATLKGQGPLTVLAPTDGAFANLAAGTLEGMLRLESGRERLLWVLSCHVVVGQVSLAGLRNGSIVRTLHGEPVRISVEGNVVKADGAQVVQADIVCANGLLHVVDQVILPGK